MTQNRMVESTKAMTGRIIPWRDTTQWWVVVVEGAIAFLLGIYIIARPEQTSSVIVQIIGGYLLVTSLLAVYRLVTGKGAEPPGSPARWIRVGIGVVVGLIAFAHPWLSTIDTAAAATVLAIGLLIIAILGIYAIIRTHAEAGWRWNQMIEYGIYLLIGVLVFYHNWTATEWWVLPAMGWIATLGGIGLIGYGIWVYQKLKKAAAAVAATATPDTPDVVTGAPAQTAAVAEQATTSSAAITPPPAPAKQPVNGVDSTVKVDGSDDSKAVKP
jgi:uncharacterized membrane protein HdeD (DUF308 family)